jgi:hypothetical protein
MAYVLRPLLGLNYLKLVVLVEEEGKEGGGEGVVSCEIYGCG